ncbi:MAG: class II aldolase/adducin family protein [Candidatus Omnitrophota bacterium]
MNKAKVKKCKQEIIEIGRLLWNKDLATGLNGNISVRVDEELILLTAHGTCLGRLEEKDLILMDLDGNLIEKGEVSTEKLLHTEIYRNFKDTQAIIHTHSVYINGYFVANEKLSPAIFESKLYLGEMTAVPQTTPAVTDARPVLQAMKNKNIAVLRNHGAVATGKNLFECFLLIQSLEEAIKVDVIRRLYQEGTSQNLQSTQEAKALKKYDLFSKEQIDEIVRLVNNDAQLKELGEKTQMTMDLAVKLNESGNIHSFKFKEGRIVDVGKDENAEFLISASEDIWRAVFNREIDPFVATTQKKMDLRGDFAKISKWYAPCSRIFELWQQVPVN